MVCRERQRPLLKVVVLSPHGSATASAQKYLDAQGLSCLHWLGSDVSQAATAHEDGLEYIANTVAHYLKDAVAAGICRFRQSMVSFRAAVRTQNSY